MKPHKVENVCHSSEESWLVCFGIHQSLFLINKISALFTTSEFVKYFTNV